MDITPLIPKGRNIINAYSDSGFKISDKNFSGSVMLSPNNVIEISIKEDNFLEAGQLVSLVESFAENHIEVLLIGTGKKHIRLSQHLRQDLHNKLKEKSPFLSIDEMTTSAACRTFNILTLEDRKVGAILIV